MILYLYYLQLKIIFHLGIVSNRCKLWCMKKKPKNPQKTKTKKTRTGVGRDSEGEYIVQESLTTDCKQIIFGFRFQGLWRPTSGEGEGVQLKIRMKTSIFTPCILCWKNLTELEFALLHRLFLSVQAKLFSLFDKKQNRLMSHKGYRKNRVFFYYRHMSFYHLLT